MLPGFIGFGWFAPSVHLMNMNIVAKDWKVTKIPYSI